MARLTSERLSEILDAANGILDKYLALTDELRLFQAQDERSIDVETLLSIIANYQANAEDIRTISSERNHFKTHTNRNRAEAASLRERRRNEKDPDEYISLNFDLEEAKITRSSMQPIRRKTSLPDISTRPTSLIPDPPWQLPPEDERTTGDYHELLRRIYGATFVDKGTIHFVLIANDPNYATLPEEEQIPRWEKIVNALLKEDYVVDAPLNRVNITDR